MHKALHFSLETSNFPLFSLLVLSLCVFDTKLSFSRSLQIAVNGNCVNKSLEYLIDCMGNGNKFDSHRDENFFTSRTFAIETRKKSHRVDCYLGVLAEILRFEQP